MSNIIKLSEVQYDELMNKVSDIERDKKDDEVLNVFLSSFKVDIPESPFIFAFSFGKNTKILSAYIIDRQSNKYARFITSRPLELSWGGLYLSDVVWDKKSDIDIMNYYNEQRTLKVPMPSILEGHMQRYLSVIVMFEQLNKALISLPSLWHVGVDAETKLLKAIFGTKESDGDTIYTIKEGVSIAKAKPSYRFNVKDFIPYE